MICTPHPILFDKIEKNEMSRACIEEKRGIYRVLVGKPERKILPGRPRHRWEDNVKMDLQEMGSGSMDWLKLAGTCQCGNEPSGSIKCRQFLD